MAAAVVHRPPISATPGASLAALAAVIMSGTPPAFSDARQYALTSKLPFHISKSLTPSDLAGLIQDLSVRGGAADMELQHTTPPATVASMSGHPTSIFDSADTETAAKSLSHQVGQGGLASAADPSTGLVTDSDPALASTIPDDDISTADVDDDDDGLEHPSDNAPFTAPPKDYKLLPYHHRGP